jgi:hypothetical protein
MLDELGKQHCCLNNYKQNVTALDTTHVVYTKINRPACLWFIPQVIYEYGDSRWNDVDRENLRIGRETCPNATCPTQIPHGMTRARTQASAVRSRRPRAWTVARPSCYNCRSSSPSVFRWNFGNYEQVHTTHNPENYDIFTSVRTSDLTPYSSSFTSLLM